MLYVMKISRRRQGLECAGVKEEGRGKIMRKTIKKAAALAMSTISAAGTLAGCDSKSANGTAPDSESPKISEITDRKAVDLDKPYEEVKLTR